MKLTVEGVNVCDALYSRLIRVFGNGLPVFFSFSGGKDSLVIAQALYELIGRREIDPRQLHVMFIDEEAIYPCVERIVLAWRQRFMVAGASFHWLCIEFRHFNCFNSLSQDLSFICWDPSKRSVWIREKPGFAMTSHPLFRAGDTYQKFSERMTGVVHVIGIRASESIQRLNSLARNGGVTFHNSYNVYPIYDWSLNDIWLYLHEHGVEIPDAYLYMWRAGVPVNRLRISQFFSIDTAPSLVRLMEYYPGLYEKILAREPNAYLAMFYYDTEMFRRTSRKRKELEALEEVDWRAKYFEKLAEPDTQAMPEAARTRTAVVKYGTIMQPKHWKLLYEILVAGDPKLRTLRSVYSSLGREYHGEVRRG